MTNEEALKNKADCIIARLRGDAIEYRTVGGDWIPLARGSSFNDCGDMYRIAAKPEPKMPKGTFWVRHKGRDDIYLVSIFRGDGGFSLNMGIGYWSAFEADEALHYSHDREAWFTFTGEPVK